MDETREFLAERRQSGASHAYASEEIGPQEQLHAQVERARMIRTFYMALVGEGFREPEALLLTGRLFHN